MMLKVIVTEVQLRLCTKLFLLSDIMTVKGARVFYKNMCFVWWRISILPCRWSSVLLISFWWIWQRKSYTRIGCNDTYSGKNPTFRRNISLPSSRLKRKPRKTPVEAGVMLSSAFLLIQFSFSWLTLRLWRWKRYIPPKHWTLSKLHGVTSQRIWNLRNLQMVFKILNLLALLNSLPSAIT
jgi:hypothetical protein